MNVFLLLYLYKSLAPTVQSVNWLGEGECRWEGAVTNKYSISQSLNCLIALKQLSKSQ